MKKIYRLLIAFFIIYFVFSFIFSYFSKGYTSTYKLNGYKVVEKRVRRTKGVLDNYYFEISKKDSTFKLQTLKNISKQQNVIKKIKHFKNDEYECILPIFKKDVVLSDIICLSNDKYYYYNSLVGKDNDLDRFAKSLSKYRVDFASFKNIIKSDEYLSIYDNFNTLKLGIENYKGLYITDKSGIKKIELFKDDIYTKDISAFTKDYYIVADYNEQYDFHKFYVVNLKTGKKSFLISNNKISMYSYILGSIDNSIYLIDPTYKLEYEINIKDRYIRIVGNEKKGIKYYNFDKWEDVNFYDVVNNKMVFKYSSTTFNNIEYPRVDFKGLTLSGYYYIYTKNKNKYDAYKVNAQDKNMIYLFTIDNIDSIIYFDDYIIYRDSNYIRYYSDLTGVKTLVKYDEADFNKSLKFGITR
jgi:hypothetical protein